MILKKRNIRLKESHTTNKSFYIENLGCAKNQVDAEYILYKLNQLGWQKKDEAEDAYLIIINTCGFISVAKRQSLDITLAYRQKFPEKKILFAGCMAERYANDLYEDLSEVDGFFGNADLTKVKEAIEQLSTGERFVFLPEKQNNINELKHKREEFFSYPGSVYVKIAEGCSNMCSFCAIPLIRGKVESRTIASVIAEIKELIKKDIKEINLIAQDLSSFGQDRGEKELPQLLREISKLEGEFWVRLLYIHPDYFPEELFEIMKEDKRILPYFDLPFQHVAPNVLSKMNRKGDYKTYTDLVAKIRSEIPNAVIRSTFMLGFPGERSSDYKQLANFLLENRLDWVGFFVFSREENTKAYNLGSKRFDKIKTKIANVRRKELEILQQEIILEKLDQLINEVFPVLIEEEIPEEGLFIGRSYFQAPEVDGYIVVEAEALKAGEVYNCRIIRRQGFDFTAVVEE